MISQIQSLQELTLRWVFSRRIRLYNWQVCFYPKIQKGKETGLA
jgi:hypothetical protein